MTVVVCVGVDVIRLFVAVRVLVLPQAGAGYFSRCLDVLSGGCRGASAVGGERGERSLTPFQLAGSATPLVAPEAGVR